MLSLGFTPFSYSSVASRFLLGLARADARANLADPSKGERNGEEEKEGERKKKWKKENKSKEGRGQSLIHSSRRNGSLLLKYASAVVSAGGYAYIDLPARHGVNIHAGLSEKSPARASRALFANVRLEKADAFCVWILYLYPSGQLIAISNGLTTDSFLCRQRPSYFLCFVRSPCLLFHVT